MSDINEYIESLIPENISKKKRADIKNELLCHIYDRADYYMDIGYTKEQSMEKAIENMGKDEKTKEKVKAEFDELYHEKTLWAVITAVGLAAMNIVALFAGIWMFSADTYHPDSYAYPVSFAMVFAMFVCIYVARRNRFGKMLTAIGVVNVITAVIPLACAYPQCAVYSVFANVMYFLDRYTSIFTKNVYDYWDQTVVMTGCCLLLLGSAVYCFKTAYTIKHGETKQNVKSYHAIAFAGVYLAIAVCSTFIFEGAKNYFYSYPKFFIDTCSISQKSQSAFDEIGKCSEYKEAVKVLTDTGFMSFTDYKKSLDKETEKKFNHVLRESIFRNVDEGKIFFIPPAKYSDHYNSYVYLYENNEGGIEMYGVGNINGNIDRCDANVSKTVDIDDLLKMFKEFNKGDEKQKLVDLCIAEGGVIYGDKVTNKDSGRYEDIWLYFEGKGMLDYWKGSVYMSLSFKNGKLYDGSCYYYDHIGKRDVTLVVS